MAKTLKDKYYERYLDKKNEAFEEEGNEPEPFRVLKTIDDYISTPEGERQMLDCIKEIMNTIDFQKIHDTMEALDWHWYFTGDQVPTIKQIKENLLNLLCELFEDRCNEISSGGFTMSYKIYEPMDNEPDDFNHCVEVRVYFAVEEYNNML